MYSNDGKKLSTGIVVMYRVLVDGRWLPWVSNADPEWMSSVQIKYNLGGTFFDMVKTYFCTGDFENIIEDMIEHFMGEKDDNFDESVNGYSIYKNNMLTSKVKNHTKSSTYIDNVVDSLMTVLQQKSGEVEELIYDLQLRFNKRKREEQVMVAKLIEHDVSEPVFNTKEDIINGLTMCIDSLHSNKIEVTSYQLNGNHYNGTIKITYYDHFGLDAGDFSGNYNSIIKTTAVNKLGGFRQWYILQHWNGIEYSKHPKPFITTIEITCPFSGDVN